MTSLLRLSGLTAITLTAALSMTAGLAIAGENVSAKKKHTDYERRKQDVGDQR